MKITYDITLSVWNTFFAREQCAGFHNASLNVHSIGTQRHIDMATRHDIAIASAGLLKLFHHTGKEGLREWSLNIFELEAAWRLHNSPLLWTLGGASLATIRRAQRRSMHIVLDVASAHKRLQLEVLEEEYRKCGIPFPIDFYRRWADKSEKEYAMADCLTVGSSYVRQTLVERGVDEKRIVINPYGVRTEAWQKASQGRKWNAAPMIFIYTASLIPRKGVQYLVRAWKKANLKNSELWICGGGFSGDGFPWKEVCGILPDSIKILGQKTHAELIEIYRQAHVYILPSLLEGLARSGLEAMLAGLPVIVTKETGLTDFVTHGQQGWIIETRNEDSIAERLLWCTQHRHEVEQAGKHASSISQDVSFESYGQRCVAIVKAARMGNVAQLSALFPEKK